MSDRSLPGIQQPRGNPKRQWLIALGGFIALCVIVGGCSALTSMNREPYDPNNKAEAIAQCEARVEQDLKSPTTADFDSTASGYGTWTVTGTVDAENSFGAMVRATYGCTVIVSGQNIRVSLDSFD